MTSSIVNGGTRIWVWLLVLGGLVACGTLVAPQDWDARRGPVVPHDTFPADCRLCHLGDGWHEIRPDFEFDHAGETGVALDGAHAGAECLRCHNDRGPVAVFAARGCAGCHVDPHEGRLGGACDSCHGAEHWVPREQIAMHARTRMPLVGAHAAAQCWQCHPGAEVGNFEGLDPTCTVCHADDLARATSPDHRVQGWTTDCQRCHVPIAWQPARFAHPSSLPLIGGHAGLQCATCHGSTGTFTGLSPDCVSCHLADYQGVRSPDHVAGGFAMDCRQCHSVIGWEGARFDHPASFPLTGGHAGRSCTECHSGGVFQGTPNACVACHRDDYDSVRDPDHRAFAFPTDCTACHTTVAWTGARFEHRFPIQGGAHGALSCNQCHTTAGASAFTCTDCHAHTRGEMDDEHDDVGGYVYATPDCYRCHPMGRER